MGDAGIPRAVSLQYIRASRGPAAAYLCADEVSSRGDNIFSAKAAPRGHAGPTAPSIALRALRTSAARGAGRGIYAAIIAIDRTLEINRAPNRSRNR